MAETRYRWTLGQGADCSDAAMRLGMRANGEPNRANDAPRPWRAAVKAPSATQAVSLRTNPIPQSTCALLVLPSPGAKHDDLSNASSMRRSRLSGKHGLAAVPIRKKCICVYIGMHAARRCAGRSCRSLRALVRVQALDAAQTAGHASASNGHLRKLQNDLGQHEAGLRF